MVKQQHPAVSKYVVARDPAAYPAEADTYTVVYETRENISHHENLADARAAIERYEGADRRRKAS